MGPCRIDPFGTGPREGVCGATAQTIVARNLARKIAAGCSAHSDHGRTVAEALLLAAENPASGYKIKDEKKLRKVAEELGVAQEGKAVAAVAKGVAEACLNEFGKVHGELVMAQRAPEPRKARWRELGIMPGAIDREVVRLLHQTNMGVDADPMNLLLSGMRCALADGWGGSMIATDLQDIIFGSPEPVRSKTNLGVLKPGKVNVIVHGHEPVLSDMLVEASRDAEILAKAKEVGAEGIQLAGVCCTGNEILMRRGVPSAGSFLHQELALLTGAVEAMVVDVQCCMPGLPRLAEHYHTQLITTSPKAKMPGVRHIQFEESRAYEVAKEILTAAIEAFPKRDAARVNIPKQEVDLVAGFTAEYVHTLLGGRFRPSYRPLNDAIISGRIRGVAGVVGCENPHFTQGKGHVDMMKELIRNDVLVVSSGCSALAAAREGLLTPEAARIHAGRGLAEVCEAVGMPPILHVGSCVDNSRILIACCEILKEGGLGNDISDLPAAGAAPEWMSEKAITIGFYVVASGIYTVFGEPQPVMGSPEVRDLMCRQFEEMVGGRYDFEADPIRAAHMMIEHMNQKRAALKLQPMMYEGEAQEPALAAK
jgi:carbon-monoxide dehydrogenase catalytic subunit